MNVSLSDFGTVTLDAAGNGTARIGPTAHGVVWRPDVASIRMTGAIPAGLATCFVYAGSTATDDNFVDSTYDVTSASTGNVTGQELRLGQYVFAKWSGGNPGALATVTVSGAKEIS